MSEDSKKGLIGMILAAVSVCLSWEWAAGFIGLIFSVAALVLAIIAMNKLKPLKGMTEKPGAVFVKIGSILAIIGLILSIIAIVLSTVCGILACAGGLLDTIASY